MSAYYPVVTVDGPAASGKSTFARKLSAHLAFVFVSSGVMYRGLTWFLIQGGLDIKDEAAITSTVEGLVFSSELKNGELKFLINSYDVIEHIRDMIVNDGVSQVASVPLVRKLLVQQQRQLALLAPLVMEGRDIGTAVFPDSPFKFYIDADAALRAERRRKQGEKDSVLKRDLIDSTRKVSPLSRAEDAQVLNSGELSPEEMLERATAYLKQRGLEFGGAKAPKPAELPEQK